MSLYVIRHAHAGSRSAWQEDDFVRPLSAKGLLQAQAIAERIAPLKPSVLWTSPYLRCQQTLEPLGELCGLTVQHDARLQEESPLDKALAVLEDAPDNAVLCSHGDVIPELINGLIRRGMELGDKPPAIRKASVFVLHHVNDLFTHAEYWGPPAL